MARIRTIKPGFFEHPKMARLSHSARLHYIGTWCYVDDAGRGYDDPRLLRAAIWPQDDDVTLEVVTRLQQELDDLGLIERWTDGSGRACFRVRSWAEHQKINRPSTPKIEPSPEEIAAGSVTTPGALTEPSGTEAEAEAEVDGGSGGGDFEARVRLETSKRIASRRDKGHDIGPALEKLIEGDVRRELAAAPKATAAALPDAVDVMAAALPPDDEIAPPPAHLRRSA